MPPHPDSLKSAVLSIISVSKGRQCEPDIPQNTRWHVPDECFEIPHPAHGKRDQCAEHLAAFFVDLILLHPICRAIAK
jgi:hypothetical protein